MSSLLGGLLIAVRDTVRRIVVINTIWLIGKISDFSKTGTEAYHTDEKIVAYLKNPKLQSGKQDFVKSVF